MEQKTASSQVAWALLTEGVTLARVESHRLRHLINRATQLVEKSKFEDHIYQVAGDIIEGLPRRLTALEVALDRTALALSKMGDEFLDSRLPLGDKMMVDEAVEAAFGKSRPFRSIEARIVARYLKERLGEES